MEMKEIYMETIPEKLKTLENLIYSDRLSEAKDLFEIYDNIFNKNSDYRSMKAIIAIKENRLDDAFQILNDTVGFDKTNPDIFYNLAYVNLLKDNKISALKHYRSCLDLTHNDEFKKQILNNIDYLISNIYSLTDDYGHNTNKADFSLVKRVLCVHEKYYGYNKKFDFSAINMSLTGTIVDSGVSEQVKTFYYDNMVKFGINDMARALLQECYSYKPDVLIFFVPFTIYEPLLETILYIRNTLKIKTVSFFSDLLTGLVSPERHSAFNAYGEAADCMFDPCSAGSRAYYVHTNLVSAHGLVNRNIFYPMNPVKDIDVSFIGSLTTDFYRSRREQLEYLKERLEKKGYNIYIGGGQFAVNGEKPLTIDQYVDIICRSRISINFSETIGGMRNLKGRVFEVLACRTLLMEEDGPDSRRLFEDGKDYALFKSKEELYEKTLYYLENETKRKEVEQCGWEQVDRFYNSKNVWHYVFSSIGYNTSLKTNSENYRIYAKAMDNINADIQCIYPMVHSNNPIHLRINEDDYELAEKMALKKIRFVPNDAEAWYALAEALAKLGYNKTSNLIAERAACIDPFAKPAVFEKKKQGVYDESVKLKELSSILNTDSVYVTAMVITHNNENTIDGCLSSLRSAVNKIMVVDIGSEDRTVKLAARHLNCNIIKEICPDNYGAALGKGLRHCNGWVLVVKPYERLVKEDVKVVKYISSIFDNLPATPCLNVLADYGLENKPGSDFRNVEKNRFFKLKGNLSVDILGNVIFKNAPVLNTTVRIRFTSFPVKTGIN